MSIVKDLLEIIRDNKRVTTNKAVLEQHSKGLAYHEPHLPDVVVYPLDKQEVADVLAYANKQKVPITAFGVGSSLEGQIIPYEGGISLDFSYMNKIKQVYEEDFVVKVEPGVTREELNKALKRYGLFFPIDPGANATIGGMASTGASGTNSVKYGTIKDYVMGLEVVLADGSVIETGGMAVKSSAGYNLTELFVGSEGTLGIFTEITLKLVGIEEDNIAIKATFPSIESAATHAFMIMFSGVKVGKLELVDEQTIRAVNKYKQTDFLESPTLFIELSGSKEIVRHENEFVQEILNDGDCMQYEIETDSIKKEKLWEARHHVAFAILAANPGKSLLATDVCVPRSKLTDAIKQTRTIVNEANIDAGIFGHVGDGNFHAVLTYDPNDDSSIQRIKEINHQIVDYALSVGGTCTGEHGIGSGKRSYLEKEHPTSISLMREIKSVFDKNGILNPRKVL